jgi:hypothetical protein
MQELAPRDLAADSVRSEAVPEIAQRAAALTALIKADPRAALTFAFSPELLADLKSKFPQSAGLLESHGTWHGPIERWVADDATFTHSTSLTKMKAGGQTLDLYFAEPANLQSGSTVEATGVLVGNTLAVSKATPQSSTTTSNGRDNQ